MILPKKQDLDKAKNEERKRLIDDGILLASKVDKLRELSANEEKHLKDWREGSVKEAMKEVDSYTAKRDALVIEIEQIKEIQETLLKPDVKQIKEELDKMVNSEVDKRTAHLTAEYVKLEGQKVKEDQEKVSKIIADLKIQQNETDKAKSEAKSLKELAQYEYEMVREEHNTQTLAYEEKLSEVLQKEEEYEVALSLIEIKEREVKEKESDIIKREKHLASQQVALRIAMEEIKKYGNSMSTNN